MTFDARFDGVGRTELERLAADAIERAALAESTRNAAQKRCTELVLELRAYRGSGICLPGWWCNGCGYFNGSAKEIRADCRVCGAKRPT